MSSFYETVFLKDDSSLSKKINYLECEFPNSEELGILKTGINGENEVAYFFKKSSIGAYVLRDVNFETDDLKAQIDFIVITSHHCYFIECKNYNTDIVHVDEYGNFELSKKNKNKYIKYGVDSPISQVENQLTVFKKLCLNNQEKVKGLLNGVRFKNYFKTLVVFTNFRNRLDLKKAPNDIKYRILKVDNLVRQIEYDDKCYIGKRLSKKEMLDIANFILDNNVDIMYSDIDSMYKKEYDDTQKFNYKRKDLNDYKKTSSNAISMNVKGFSFQSERGKRKNTYRRKNNYYRNSFKDDIKGFLFCIVVLIVLSLYVNYSSYKKSVIKDVSLSDSQIKAINIVKSAYEESSKTGFAIINTSVCKELSSMFYDGFSCSGLPLEVKYNKDSFTILKNSKCYYLDFNENTYSSSVRNNKNDNECGDVPIGILAWDEDDIYYQKVGGYDTILTMARYVYVNNTGLDNFFEYENIEQRGGNKSLSSTYSSYVNNYFSSLTGKGSSLTGYNLSEDATSKMCQYFYFIRE